jgi:hypothetical protein
MPPVETVSETSGKPKKLKFLRNTAYNGKDYGPDCESDTAEVDSRWAMVFLANGRAVEAGAEKSGAGGAENDDAKKK